MLSGAQICSTSPFLKFKSAYIGYTYLHAVKAEAENLNKKRLGSEMLKHTRFLDNPHHMCLHKSLQKIPV